jgi:hypothetical protein
MNRLVVRVVHLMQQQHPYVKVACNGSRFCFVTVKREDVTCKPCLRALAKADMVVRQEVQL